MSSNHMPIAHGSARRELNGLLSAYEAPLLRSLAKALPSKILPDHLTLLGVFGAALTAVSLAVCHHSKYFAFAALAGLFLNWLGDSLDGTVARFRGVTRPRYGFFVDHLTDLASQVLIAIGLGASPFMRFDIVCLALIGYLILMVVTLVRLHVFRVMQIAYNGVGPTEIRVLIAAGIILAFEFATPSIRSPFGLINFFDAVALFVLCFALVTAIATFFRDLSALASQDPIRDGVCSGQEEYSTTALESELRTPGDVTA